MTKRTHKKQNREESKPLPVEKWPGEYFEEMKNISCPKCGGHKLCNSGGGFFPGDIEVNTYVCFGCKTEFDIAMSSLETE